MIQGGSQRDRLSSHPLLDVGVTPASAGLDKGTLQPLLGCKDPITPERQLREVVPKGTHLRAMVPQVELGPKTLARGALTPQEVVGLVDAIAEAVDDRGLAPGGGEGPFEGPLSLLAWVVVTSYFDVAPRIPHVQYSFIHHSHLEGVESV